MEDKFSEVGLPFYAVQVARGENEPTGIVMGIRALDSSGTPTGVVLASTTIPASDVLPMPPIGQAGLVTGHFSPGAPVEARQQYAIALHTSTRCHFVPCG